MNSNSTIIFLVAALAVVSGGLGMAMTGAFSDQKLMVTNAATGFLMGHLEVEARNADGELFAYRQTDNAVVDDGEECILKMLFATTGQTDAGRGEYNSDGALGACDGALTGAWDVIAIGTDATGVAETQVKLVAESTTDSLDRAKATAKNWSNGTGNPIKLELSKTFTSGGTHSIKESGLFNSTDVSGSGMLARQTFTAVALTSGDSITITWTFTVGD